MKLNKNFFFGTFLCIFLLINTTCWADATDPLIGKKAPLISGKNAKGRGLLKLNNLMREFSFQKDKNGKFVEVDGKYVPKIVKNVVVLNFFSLSCIPCIREIPTFNALASKYKDKSVKMIYVNVDSEVDHLEMSRFIARKNIKVPMMLPNQREAIRKYKAYSLPRLVVLNPDGKIEEIITGFNENLESELSVLIEKLLL